jgi:ribose transport system permease protein
MKGKASRYVIAVLRWAPMVFLAALVVSFASISPRFLAVDNLAAILVQSSYLIVVALGMNFVLLGAGVDLSVGAAMYLAALAVGMALPHAPVGVALLATLVVGALFGTINAGLIVRFKVPAFIATLAMIFVGRGAGLFFSSTKIIYANPVVAALGRASLLRIPVPLVIAGAALGVAWILLQRTSLGPAIRSIGADAEGARRVGVPIDRVRGAVYILCGAYAGVGGFISLSQTSAASGAFGENSEFLAIAAAVLGGTSLFGGRGSVWAPVMGAVLIMTVQNGLGLIDANPYAYPVITGGVIFVAALLDSVRSSLGERFGRRPLRVDESQTTAVRGSTG